MEGCAFTFGPTASRWTSRLAAAALLSGLGCLSRTGFGELPPGDEDTPLLVAQNGLAASYQHTCALTTTGAARCFGSNDAGQLGTNDINDRNTPTPVSGDITWSQLAAGERHTCGVTPERQLYCWGDNQSGQLGVGEDLAPHLVPTRVGVDSDWARVAAGGVNTCGLKTNGVLYCWGSSVDGNTGLDDARNLPPVTTPMPVAGGHRWRTVTMGQGHTCAIRTDSSLWCWGRAQAGELGVSTIQPQERAPRQVAGPTWLGVSASQHHTCGIRDEGTLWCWGADSFGELGLDFAEPTEQYAYLPTQVGDFASWEQIILGWFHTCGVRDGGALYCWGRDVEGQLGRGGGPDQAVPVRMGVLADWNEVVLGAFHTCASRSGVGLSCWGANDEGQLGSGDNDRRNVPAPVTF